MGTYAISGSASGMGRETAHRLRADGHTVIGVDVKDADIVADLSTPTAADRRPTASWRPRAADSTVPCWRPASVRARGGIGPARSLRSITSGWWSCSSRGDRHWPRRNTRRSSSSPAIRRRRCPRCPGGRCKALLAHDADKAVRSVRLFGPAAPTMMYGGIEDRGQPLGAAARGASGVGRVGRAPERRRARRDHDAASPGTAVDAQAGEGGPDVPGSSRRLRRRQAHGRLDAFHAVGFSRLPLRQHRLRRRRYRCVLPIRRLAEGGAGTPAVGLSPPVQKLVVTSRLVAPRVCPTPQNGFSWRLPRRGAPVKRPRWNSMSRRIGRTDKGLRLCQHCRTG